MKERIYKYDNIKALLIFLVVVGHLTTDYVSDYHCVRWVTLWIYAFHMPAFIFVSGLLHKPYITKAQAELGVRGNTSMRWEKVIGFLLCAYALKAFLFFFRTAIGQHPRWSWVDEPGIPWYLIVMAEYEILLYLMRNIDTRRKQQIAVIAAFAVSAAVGYLPAIGDTLCLSRMINFLPIFLLGYYIDTARITELSRKTWPKVVSAVVIASSLLACYLAPWLAYRLRKYFTGRRSYEFLETFFPGTFKYAWLIRLATWAVALVITFAVVIIIPNKNLGFVSKIGERSLSVYFWHRPFCYWICGMGVYPTLVQTCGSDGLALAVYILLALAMTFFFGLSIFTHPTGDLMNLSRKLVGKK